MGYFAELDENNIVKQVIVVDDSVIDNNEENGINFLFDHYGHKNWKQTWKYAEGENLRKNYAGIGYSYNQSLDAFIPSKPYESWSLNEDIAIWQPPIPKPNDGKMYYWNEDEMSWILDNTFL